MGQQRHQRVPSDMGERGVRLKQRKVVWCVNMLKSLKAHSKQINSDLELMGHPQCLPISTQSACF